MKYTNKTGIPLSLAVWLANDQYIHVDDPKYFSATSLLKPMKAIVLSKRLTESTTTDIESLIPSRMGTALHSGMETAWLIPGSAQKALAELGYPKEVINKVVINPNENELTDTCIPIYVEQRREKQINGYTISGMYDFVGDGRLEDLKSTSVWSWIFGDKNQDYINQGSVYKWLNPEIITKDEMAIQYLFTDWSAVKARQDKSYPQSRTKELILPLRTVEDTEQFLTDIISTYDRLKNAPEDKLPECTDTQLWRKPDTWKYYKNPTKLSRSTKNFDNAAEANARLVADGNVGVIINVPGEVKRCNYCPAVEVCKQAKSYIKDGTLILD